jgi:uncharacterized phage-like protein YoqJ
MKKACHTAIDKMKRLWYNNRMKQMEIFTTDGEQTAENTKCVFTGHRQLDEDFSKPRLKRAIERLIQCGVDTFYNGMAIGFDLCAAECVLAFKRKYPHIKLIACIPCYGQDKYFSDADKKRYVKILKKTDESVTLADHYHQGCMQNRDKYMVERADCMIAYCNKTTGGAAYTVKIFEKIHPDGLILFV